MLFADETPIPPWLSFLGGTFLTTLIGAIGGSVVWWFTRRDRKQKESEDREDKEEETALARLKDVMELREADCNKRISELTRRVEDLERNRDARQIERDGLRDRLALYAARNKYLESLLRRSGVTADEWEGVDSVDSLPAVNPTPRGDQL